MNEETDTAEFYVLNHDEKTKTVTNKEKEMEESKNEEEMEMSIEQLLQSELVSPEVLTNKIEIAKSKTMFGYDKSTEINGKKCTLYELRNLIVFANKKDSHVPEEVKAQRALTKQLWDKKMDSAKRGEDVDLFGSDDTDDAAKAPSDPTWQCTTDDAPQDIEEVDISAMAIHSVNGQNGDPTHHDEEEDEKQNGKKTQHSGHSTSRSVSTIKALFGDIKKYEYADYVPPTINSDDYFDVERWRIRRMDAMSERANRKKKKATTLVMEDRRETFVINPAECQMTTKAFKLHLAMTDHFGLSIEEILAILEAAAPQSKLAAKLKQFLEIKMPRGFPIQLELPLFHVLKAKVTFQNFEHINPDDDLFAIPDDYKTVEKKDVTSPTDSL